MILRFSEAGYLVRDPPHPRACFYYPKGHFVSRRSSNVCSATTSFRRRLRIANTIWAAASSLVGLRAPEVPEHIEHGAYKCYVFVRPDVLSAGWTRDRIMSEISDLGVPCYSGGCPEVYLEKAFDGTGYRPEKRLPVARELGETSLMFLCHPTLSDDEIDLSRGALETVMRRATA